MTAPPAGPIPWQGARFPPRRWQAEALPLAIDCARRGKRGLISAVMGAGKASVIAELCWIASHKSDGRAIVVLVPSMALVEQLAATIRERCGARAVGVFYGPKKQADRPIVVCCNPSAPNLALALASLGRRVSLLVIDEAHRSQAETLREVIPLFAAKAQVGLTATPYRSIRAESLELFDEVVYRYPLQEAVLDGVLVPMRYVRIVGEELPPGSVDDVCLDMMRAECADLGPGIVSATSIADAEAYAGWLTERDWPAAAIHSRHDKRERELRLLRLRQGEVRCLVHVSLLAEGVDLPWLRWLCLRRPVGASVRFLQEIGRAFRAFPGGEPPKRDATILDPHLLLGRHGLVSSEAIGKALEEAAEEMEGREPRSARERTEAEVVALDLLVAYLEDVHRRLTDAGIVGPSKYAPGGWQLADVSEKQVDAINGASKLTRHVPGQCRAPIKALVKVPWALNRGQAAMLLDVLFGGARWARPQIDVEAGVYPSQVQWSPWLVRVDAPDHETILAAGRSGRKMEPERTSDAAADVGGTQTSKEK